MLALRYVYGLALAIWLGGMVVLGALVAPTTFEALQTGVPETGRALAGDVFGKTIARFHYVGLPVAARLSSRWPQWRCSVRDRAVSRFASSCRASCFSWRSMPDSRSSARWTPRG
jgi:hypothetical protein